MMTSMHNTLIHSHAVRAMGRDECIRLTRLVRSSSAAETSSPAPCVVARAESRGAEASHVATAIVRTRFVRMALSFRHGASEVRDANRVEAHQDQQGHADVVADPVDLTVS